ncbi:MAG: P1 family peptidase [Gammaproteobacteria bacterium]|nr:P1 family peptidase [Gammaproteobacteria bacterium]
MSALTTTPAGKTRARGAGLPFAGEPGQYNAITDVAGVLVGYTTLIEGEDVRTGVTAILPRPHAAIATPVFAGIHSLNGNGELTGTLWIDEAGRLEGPITITNTHSCGTARDASIKWLASKGGPRDAFALPVAGETYDGYLNDINGFHVEDRHVMAALDNAAGGAVEEGSVGGGTGMICYGYKGGSGTASRRITFAEDNYTVGVFLQANFGRRDQLTVAGVPVGRALSQQAGAVERGSVIGIVATDAPFMPHQLQRLARRVGLGIGRSGAISGHGSGDIFLAFSTANSAAHHDEERLAALHFVPDGQIDGFFAAVIHAVDEAVMNALFANESMTGRAGHVVEALPHAAVLAELRAHGVVLST